jgi:hypothetical protein
MSPPPNTFECQCGSTRVSPDAQVPVGWSKSGGFVWCDDCSRAGVPERHHRQHARKARRAA